MSLLEEHAKNPLDFLISSNKSDIVSRKTSLGSNFNPNLKVVNTFEYSSFLDFIYVL